MENKPGINFKELENGNIRQSYHLPTFINFFSKHTNDEGWFTLDVEKLQEPTVKGYTHRFNIKNRPRN